LALQKCDELNISDERDEDDEFEEVPVYRDDKESNIEHKNIKANCTEQSNKPIKSTLQGLFAPTDFPDIDQDPTYAHTNRAPFNLSSVAQGKQPMDMNDKVDEGQQQHNNNNNNNNNNNSNADNEIDDSNPQRAGNYYYLLFNK
jgi:hypothetical protein